jgi:glycosyltransferase involved in cell wall biosynthesis
MRLDLAIAAYNEEEVILPTIALVKASLDTVPDLDYRIIVAENGSTDRTLEVVRDANIPGVEVFHAPKKGKGAALIEAAKRSDAEYFGFVDADTSPHPDALITALERIVDSGATLVTGSRFHPESKVDRGPLRSASSRAFNMLSRAIVGVRIDDTQCPLKIMTRGALPYLLASEDGGWFLDLEFVARIERAGLSIASIPVVWTEFRYPGRESKLSMTQDGARAIAAMLKLRHRLDAEFANR